MKSIYSDEEDLNKDTQSFESSSSVNTSMNSFLKWITQKKDGLLKKQEEVVYQISQGLAKEYSPQILVFLMNLVFHRCLLTKKKGIPHSQVRSLRKAIRDPDQLHTKIADLLTRNLEKTSAKGKKKRKDLISKTKQTEIDDLLSVIIQKSLQNQLVPTDQPPFGIGESEFKSMIELGLFDVEVSCSKWIVVLVDMVGIILNTQKNFCDMGVNALTLLRVILVAVIDSSLACPAKFQIFQKILKLFIIAQDNEARDIRVQAVSILKAQFVDVLRSLFFPLKRTSNNLVEYFQGKLQKTKISRKRKKKKAQSNFDTEHRSFIQKIREIEVSIEEEMVLLATQPLARFQKKYSTEEQLRSLQFLLLILESLVGSEHPSLFEKVKEKVFLHRGKLMEFVVLRAHQVKHFESMLESFLKLSEFGDFQSSFDESTFVKSIILNQEKINLDLRGHSLLDNMVYKDYTVNQYRGQMVTQKNYLMVFLLMLNPNPEVSSITRKCFVRYLNQVFKRRNSDTVPTQTTTLTKEQFLEVVLIVYQMAALRCEEYQEVFTEVRVPISVSVKTKELFSVLRSLLWDEKLASNLLDWYFELSFKFLQHFPSDKDVKSSSHSNMFYSLEELLCQGILSFFKECFDGNQCVDPNSERELTPAEDERQQNHYLLLSLFEQSRDHLIELAFRKMEVYQQHIVLETNTKGGDSVGQPHCDSSKVYEQAVLVVKLLKKEVRTSQKQLADTHRISLRLDSVKDPRLLRNLIEWMYLFGKRHPDLVTKHPMCDLEAIFDKNKNKLQTYLKASPTDMNRDALTCLLRIRFSAFYLTRVWSLYAKLDFVFEVLRKYEEQYWSYSSVEVIVSCVHLLFFIMESVYIKILDVARSPTKGEDIQSFIECRPRVAKALQRLCSYRSDQLSFTGLLEIRKEAFESLVKYHLLTGNDVFKEYKLIYTEPSKHDVDLVKGFLLDFVCVGTKHRDTGLEHKEVVNVIPTEKGFSQMLTSNKKKIVSESRTQIEGLLQSEDLQGKEDYSTPAKTDLSKSVDANQNVWQSLRSEHQQEASLFWKSMTGVDLQYYLTLKVFDLIEDCSETYWVLLVPELISRFSEDLDFKDHSVSVLYSYLNKVLQNDQNQGKAFFWKFYLKSARLEGMTLKKLSSITRLFMHVYKNSFKRLKARNKEVVKMIQNSPESNTRQIMFRNFLNFSAYLIKEIDLNRDDYTRMIPQLLVDQILRKTHFESTRFYYDILLLLHKKIQEVESTGDHDKQKLLVERFLEKELKQKGETDNLFQMEVIPEQQDAAILETKETQNGDEEISRSQDKDNIKIQEESGFKDKRNQIQEEVPEPTKNKRPKQRKKKTKTTKTRSRTRRKKKQK